MKLRQTVIKIAVVFLLLLVALTFFSRTIKNSMLPKVRAVVPSEGTIRHSLMVYDYEYASVDAGFVVAEGAWAVDAVFVEEGDKVEEGDILYTIDTAKYRAELLRLQAAAVTLDNALENPYLPEADRKAIELNRYAAWQEYRILRDSYPSEGEVLSPFSGTVEAVNIERYDVLSAGQKVMEIFGSESKTAVKFDVSFIEHNTYETVNTAIVRFIVGDELVTEKLPIYEKEMTDTGYSYYAEIPKVYTYSSVIQNIELERRSANYSFVVPTSAIQEDMYGNFIYAVTEEKKGQSIVNRVTTYPVNVLERGDAYSAIEFSSYFFQYPVVEFATKSIVDGSEVILL